MSLEHKPLVYLFLETQNLAAKRHLLETDVGLPVIGVDETPGVRHGVVDFDAGALIVSLNLSSHRRSTRDGTDGLVTVFDVARGSSMITDEDSHRYLLNATPACRAPCVAELRLATADVESSAAFYRDVLRLTQLSPTEFAAGAVTLMLQHVPETRRHDTYLLVFHTHEIERTCDALSSTGLTFKGRKVGTRDFGSTIHFDDPSGHRFCLYEPSPEALRTDTGRKLRQILACCEMTLPIGLQ